MPLSYNNKKLNPHEALGLLTYTIEATNSFVKFREAWLPISRSTHLQLSLAWLPMNLMAQLLVTLS